MAQLPASAIQSLARNLADSTAENKDYFSAATIHLDYLEDIESSARLLCKGYHFAEAMRILSLNKRQDLLEEIVDAGLAEGLASTTELLADCKTQLAAQVPRLRELRTKKEEDPCKPYPQRSTLPLVKLFTDWLSCSGFLRRHRSHRHSRQHLPRTHQHLHIRRFPLHALHQPHQRHAQHEHHAQNIQEQAPRRA